MARLGMTPEEYDYWVSNISEAFDLIGQDAELYQVAEIDKDLYNDVEYFKHFTPRKIGLIFEDNPKPVLKKFNWLMEEEEIPYVVYLCSKDSSQRSLVVQEHMIVRVESVLGLESERLFQVSSCRGSSIDPLFWICKLVPYRMKVDFNPDTKEIEPTRVRKNDTNFAYLNIDKDRHNKC